MSWMMVLTAGLFLPLFPFSMVFNVLYGRLGGGGRVLPRMVLLLVWPQLGLVLLSATEGAPPDWILPLALFTSALYAFRALALREVGQWTGFLATSLWALLWLSVSHGDASVPPAVHALGLSAPLMLLALLTGGLERRFGAAYTGLPGGLAQQLPRLSGVLVVVVFAAIAAPLFPAFFTLLGLVVHTLPAAPAGAVAVLGIWLLWSWAGARLLQGLIIGPAGARPVADLSAAGAWSYAMVLALLAIAGLWRTGGLP